MIVKVFRDEITEDESGIKEVVTDTEIPDDEIIKEITTSGIPEYWYVLVDGKLFKSNQEKGIKSIFFKSKEDAETYVAHALYWHRKLIPDIGCACGYDTESFYKKLLGTHKVEFKKIELQKSAVEKVCSLIKSSYI